MSKKGWPDIKTLKMFRKIVIILFAEPEGREEWPRQRLLLAAGECREMNRRHSDEIRARETEKGRGRLCVIR